MIWTPRNIFGMVGLAALIAFAFYFQHIRDKAQKLDATVALLETERARFADWKQNQKDRDDASTGYQNELQALRRDVSSRPAPVIRVCPSPVAGTIPTIAAGPDPAAAPAGGVPESTGLPVESGADIGEPLQRMFARCDGLSAQVRAILDYYKE